MVYLRNLDNTKEYGKKETRRRRGKMKAIIQMKCTLWRIFLVKKPIWWKAFERVSDVYLTTYMWE